MPPTPGAAAVLQNQPFIVDSRSLVSPGASPGSVAALPPENAGRRVAAGAAGLFVLKIAYSGLGFGLGVALARALGPAAYGSYMYAQSWAVFIGVPAALGLDKFVVRQVAVDRDRHDWAHLRGVLWTANRAGLLASMLLIGLAAGVAVTAMHAGDERAALLVGLLLVPVLTVMKIRQAALTGLHQIVRGQWPELLLHPALLITIVLGAWLVMGRALAAPTAMGMTVFCAAVAHVVGAWLLHRSMPAEARALRGRLVPLPWRASLWPLTVMGTIQILQSQSDTLLLGMLADARSVGIYATAYRGAALVAFFLMATVPALSPAVASLYAAGKRDELERVVVKTARTTFLLSLPVGIGLMLFGHWYLLIFGPGFTAGTLPLAILCVGQLVNVACGPVGTVMMMTGHESPAAAAIAVAAAVNVAASAVLIPAWGMLGAAVASAASMIVWNVLLAIQVRRLVGIQSTCFGRLR